MLVQDFEDDVECFATAIQWINLYLLKSETGFVNTYPLDSDLSGAVDSAIQHLNNPDLVNSGILLTTGLVWPASSGKINGKRPCVRSDTS